MLIKKYSDDVTEYLKNASEQDWERLRDINLTTGKNYCEIAEKLIKNDLTKYL